MQFLIASIQQWFWISAIKKLFKSAIQCMKCYHFKAQTSQQLMAELPHLRMQPSRPFTTRGADSAGPENATFKTIYNYMGRLCWTW